MNSRRYPFEELLELCRVGVQFDKDYCLRVRHRKASCTQCADACPTGAVRFDDGAFSVEAEQCAMCGACASACPTDALSITGQLHDGLSPEGSERKERVDVTCSALQAHLVPDDDVSVVVLPCLGNVDEGLLVGLAADGAKSMRVIVPMCFLGIGKEDSCVIQACSRASALLKAWGSAAHIEVVRSEAGGECEQDMQPSCGVCQREIAPEPFRFARFQPNGTLPHRVPSSRKILLEGLDRLGAETGTEDGLLDAALWGTVHIDVHACISCRRCAAFCPTGALFRFRTKDGRIGVKQDIATCTACRLCEDLCPQDALHLKGDAMATQVRNRMVKRLVLEPPKFEQGGPHSMAETMRKHITVDQVSEMV